MASHKPKCFSSLFSTSYHHSMPLLSNPFWNQSLYISSFLSLSFFFSSSPKQTKTHLKYKIQNTAQRSVNQSPFMILSFLIQWPSLIAVATGHGLYGFRSSHVVFISLSFSHSGLNFCCFSFSIFFHLSCGVRQKSQAHRKENRYWKKSFVVIVIAHVNGARGRS